MNASTNGILSLTDKLIAYEQGDLSNEDVVDLFQELVNSGLAWKLQGSYGRMAARLVEAGEIHLPIKKAESVGRRGTSN